jgi:hypothetical protein
MPEKFEMIMIQQVTNVVFAAREEIVEANHFVAMRDELINQVTAQEPGTACNERPLAGFRGNRVGL